MSTRFEVLKSSQLDAELLDKEILSTFQEQFQQTVQLVKVCELESLSL